MPELIKIPLSFFELSVDYEPYWIVDRAPLVKSIFDALKPWNPRIDDIEILSVGKLSEQGLTLRLPSKRISFFFGHTSFKFTREDMTWQMDHETIEILDTALSAFTAISGVKVTTKKAGIALHFQPQNVSFLEILRPFLVTQFESLEATPVTTMAVVAKWPNRKVTLDGSATLANGVFLRLERDFQGSVTSQGIAGQLREDEEQLFRILGVEEHQG